jgi:hypothetical protein
MTTRTEWHRAEVGNGLAGEVRQGLPKEVRA